MGKQTDATMALRLDHDGQPEKPSERTREQVIAAVLTDGTAGAASVLQAFPGVRSADKADITALTRALQEAAQRVHDGGLQDVEATLLQQAKACETIFYSLAGAASRSSTVPLLQTYMNLALRAQAQSRATLQALGELKAPRPVVIARQANLAQQQLVNNGGGGFNVPATAPLTRRTPQQA